NEFEELSRPNDRIWRFRFRNQLLLGDLGPHVTTFACPVGTHDRQRDVVLHAGGPLCGEQVAGGGGEEVQHVVVGPGRRVGHVDHRVGIGKGFGEAFSGEGVDTRARRGGDGLVPYLGEWGDALRADESSAADDYDLHDPYYLSGFRDELVNPVSSRGSRFETLESP